MSNVLVKRGGRLLVVPADGVHPIEIVDATWHSSLAAIMRTIGESFLTFPQDYETHVALRKKIQAIYDAQNVDPVPVSQIALAVFMILQGGAAPDGVLTMPDEKLLDYAQGLDLST